jgi:prohibitin 2
MSNRNPFEEYANRIRAQVVRTGGGRGGGFPGGSPRGLGGGIAGLVLLGGGALLFQSALFNVDGGHRAIKYRRISGVSKDIYGEGAASSGIQVFLLISDP